MSQEHQEVSLFPERLALPAFQRNAESSCSTAHRSSQKSRFLHKGMMKPQWRKGKQLEAGPVLSFPLSCRQAGSQGNLTDVQAAQQDLLPPLRKAVHQEQPPSGLGTLILLKSLDRIGSTTTHCI